MRPRPPGRRHSPACGTTRRPTSVAPMPPEAAPPAARPYSWPRRWARNAERDFRRWRRRMKWAVFDRIPAIYRLYGLATFQPGDVLLLPGNVWSWHDLDRLRRIKRETGVRLVVV